MIFSDLSACEGDALATDGTSKKKKGRFVVDDKLNLLTYPSLELLCAFVLSSLVFSVDSHGDYFSRRNP